MSQPSLRFVASLALILAWPNFAHGQQTPTEIRDSAHRRHPDDPIAGSRAANASLEDRALGASGNPKQIAAWAFLGYYAKNTSGIPRVCKTVGVEIGAYTTQFALEHKALLEISGKQVNVQEALNKAASRALEDAASELDRVAKALGVDTRGACDYVQQNGVQLAKGAHFAKVLPKIHAQLSSE